MQVFLLSVIYAFDVLCLAAVRVAQDQMRLNNEPGLTAAAALHQHKIRRGLCFVADHPEALGLDAVFCHCAEKLGKSFRLVYHINAAAGAAEEGGCGADVLKAAQGLSPCAGAAFLG